MYFPDGIAKCPTERYAHMLSSETKCWYHLDMIVKAHSLLQYFLGLKPHWDTCACEPGWRGCSIAQYKTTW